MLIDRKDLKHWEKHLLYIKYSIKVAIYMDLYKFDYQVSKVLEATFAAWGRGMKFIDHIY